MERDAILQTYRRYASRYDLYFGAVLQPGRKAAIECMRCRPGERILEVGVGTGLSLPLYPRYARVTGIDMCCEMLARARVRALDRDLNHVEALCCMDAEQMGFADANFDKVVAMYVVSVATDPVRLVKEMRRVCRPGGELYIVNHFRHRNSVVAGLEHLLAPFAKRIGFHPDLGLEELLAQTGLSVTERATVNLLGYWTLLRARNHEGAFGTPHRSKVDHTAPLRHANIMAVHRHHATYVVELANRVFGDPAKAAKWLARPSLQLGGRAPRELLASEDGARRVEELLAQIDDDNRLHSKRT